MILQSTSIDPYDITTFSICTFHSGDAINVIPDHAQMTDMLRSILSSLLGEPSIYDIPRPHMGSEDFLHYQREIPGVMMMLGAGVEGTLHTGELNIDEACLETGIAVFIAIALSLMEF